MASARRSCRNNPDFFCYICGEYKLAMHRKGITSFVKRAYQAYFQVKLDDQDKSWAPHTVCKTCVEYLQRWKKGTKTSLKFGIPMVWREPSDHETDCYFCAIDTTGINRKNRSSLQYPDLPSARRPDAHCEELPVPAGRELPDSDDEATTAACRRLPPSCWPPDSKRKIYSVTTRVSRSFVEGIRTTLATSARRKTSCTAEMSPVFLLNSALLNMIREIGDSS